MQVDLRSDTVTRPSAEMLDVMRSAPVGDDVFGDDPSVNALEEQVAREAGKERALFVPSGTMANQLALRAQTQHGDEIILHARCHIFNYESGGLAALCGLQSRALDSDDGTLHPDALDAAYRDADDVHHAPTRLVCLENTHNTCGGRVVPLAHMQRVRRWCDQHQLRLHLDGARGWNALVAAGWTLADLAAPVHSLSLCFSKGLGAPVGSVLVGDSATVERARRFRKMWGGGMRQAGVLAAAARYAMDHHVTRLADDHRRARAFALGLAGLPGVYTDPSLVETNMVYFMVMADHPLRQRGPDAVQRVLEEAGVRVLGLNGIFRAVFHLDVDDRQLDYALHVMRKTFAGA